MRKYQNQVVVRRGAAYDTLSAPMPDGSIETVDFSYAKANQRQAVVDEVISRLKAIGFFNTTKLEDDMFNAN